MSVNEKNINEEEDNNIFDSWDDENLKLDQRILRGIFSYGYEKPSPIQKKAIIPIINKNDIIAQAQSGTGKTGAFSIGVLGRIEIEKQNTQCIILSPTRELSIQTYDVLKGLSGKYPVDIQLLIGGTSIDKDISQIREKKPHIIVGCPGRIHDMLRRKEIKTAEIKLVVLDEADEMLSTGFQEQVYNILQFVSGETQICLFSATIPHEISKLSEKFMRDPIRILVKQDMLTLEGIKQYYVAIDNDISKFETIKDLFSILSLSQCIIYCNSVKRVIDLYDAMREEDFPVCTIHSSMSRDERTTSFNEFKAGKYRVLISSNVTARGIDIQQVSTVVNFDVPKCVHTYLHRIGRSGRWGRKGLGINFVTRRDVQKIKSIEQHYNTQIEELPKNFSDQLK